MKKRIKEVLGKFFLAIHTLLRFKKTILFEVEPEKRDNCEAVLREMLRRGWNRKYCLVVLTMDVEGLKGLKTKGLRIQRRSPDRETGWNSFQNWYLRTVAAVIIDENVQIAKGSSKSTHIYLSHGSPIKSVREYYNCSADTDIMVTPAEFWRPIDSYEFRIPEEKIEVLGFPRNDLLLQTDAVELPKALRGFDHIVAWYPTYRLYSDPDRIGPYMPLIHNEEDLAAVNEIAARYNVMLLLKPHPSQKFERFSRVPLTNLIVIQDGFYLQNGISPYALLRQTDGLITDYSSIFFDYLLTGKPIGLTLEDHSRYSSMVGFAIDLEIIKSCSESVNSLEDLDQFFSNLANGVDPLREERERVMRLTNRYCDARSSERVADWVAARL